MIELEIHEISAKEIRKKFGLQPHAFFKVVS